MKFSKIGALSGRYSSSSPNLSNVPKSKTIHLNYMSTTRIMVIGPMTSGKTTVASYLAENYGFKKLTLAAALKEIVKDIENNIPTTSIIQNRIFKYINLTKKEIANMEKAITLTGNIPNETPKPRKRLQFLGTEGGRQMVRNTIWIDIVKAQIKNNGKYVIDDVRFLNEYYAFLSMGFGALKLKISDSTQDKRIRDLYGNYDPKILQHPSETELKQINIDPKYCINNDGPLDHLFHYVEIILNPGNTV